MISFFGSTLLLPLVVRFALFPKREARFLDRLWGIFSDVIYSLELLLFFNTKPFFPLFIASQFYILFEAYFFAHTQIRFRFSFFKQFAYPKSYLESAKHAGLSSFLLSTAVLGIFLFFSFYFLAPSWHAPPLVWFALIPLPFILSKGEDNALIHEQRKIYESLSHRWLMRKTIPSFASDKEICTHISVDYPLLKWTKKFCGEKQFQVSFKKKPNVIFLFLESFRHRDINPVNTPNFCKLSKEGTYFSEFYANGVLTLTGAVSSLFGILPEYRPKQLKSYVSYPFIGIPHLLKKQGYQNLYLHNGNISMDRQLLFFKNHGFDFLYGKKEIQNAYPDIPSTSWGVHDEALMRFSVDRLKECKQPSFLTLFTITNHHPWTPVPAFATPEFDVPQESVYHRYLQTLHYTDYALGLLIDELKKAALLDDTLLFILADHGSAKGEHHDNQTNLQYLYEESLHIPLLILGGSQTPGVITEPCSQVDLLPTLMDPLEIEGLNHAMGRSLVRKEKRPVYFFNPYGSFLGMRKGEIKHIVNTQNKEEEVYNLSRDPNEKNNLHSPSSHKELEDVSNYMNWLYQKKRFIPSDSAPFHVRIPTDFSDEEVGKMKIAQASFLNFSHNLCITDRAMDTVTKQCKKIVSVNLSHCTGITDRSLSFIAQRCSHLRYLHLSDCHTLSEEGIKMVFQKCCQVEDFRLQNFPTLSEKVWEKAKMQPLVLDLSGTQITAQALPFLSRLLDRVIVLGLNCEHFTDEDLNLVAGKTSEVLHLQLENGQGLSEQSLTRIIQNNPDLKILSLVDFPELTDSFVEVLKDSSLIMISLQNVPHISEKALSEIPLFPPFQISSDEIWSTISG